MRARVIIDLDEKDAPRIAKEDWTVIAPGVKERTIQLGKYKGKQVSHYCQDCLTPFPEMFMVRNQLWQQMGLDGLICIDCFERRLGRPLTRRDFSSAPINKFLLRPPMEP